MRRPTAAVILIISLFMSVPVIAGELNDGIASYDRGDYETAYRLIKPLAEQGSSKAQNNLGIMYDKGQGVPQDYTEAVKWYLKAAKKGNARAQTNLGLMYYKGRGVPQDYAEAAKWYRKAADQGRVDAQFALGGIYFGGEGVPQDYAEAARCFRKAADQGFPPAQVFLGYMYSSGQGVPQDDVLAHMWLNLGIPGFPPGIDTKLPTVTINEVASRMTDAQIIEAQKLAREWKPKMER